MASATAIVIRILLLFSSLASFIPQCCRVLTTRTYDGVSLYYIFLNLIVATEQFALGLQFNVDNAETADDIIGSPPAVGDWLNLGQFAVVWLGHLTLFCLCLYYPPERAGSKRSIVALYVAFLLISIAPVIFESTIPAQGESAAQGRRWFSAIFSGTHLIFINPIVTFLGFLSLFPQARETLSRPSPGVLSTKGLFVQSVVFALVAFSWLSRMRIDSELWEMPLRRRLYAWFQLVGWAAVDNAIFASVQAVLLRIAVHGGLRNNAIDLRGETSPLLPG